MNIEIKYEVIPPDGVAHLCSSVWVMYENKACEGHVIKITTETEWLDPRSREAKTTIVYKVKIYHNSTQKDFPEKKVFKSKEDLLKSL